MNINIGGTKKWALVEATVRDKWKVLDIAGQPEYKHDLNSGDPLPFEDGSVSAFYTSHTLEHVRHWLVVPLLTEMRRSLVTDGKVRVIVPDIEKQIAAYCRRDSRWQKKGWKKRTYNYMYPDTHLGTLMGFFYSYTKGGSRDGHHMAFDVQTLEWCLRKAGFRRTQLLQYQRCSRVFDGLDFKRHAGASLYMEATK